jgi:hypothetical protein
LHGRQDYAYKISKHLNKDEKDSANIETLNIMEWEGYLEQLWIEQGGAEAMKVDEGRINEVDEIDLFEVQWALKLTKNKNSYGTDNLNTLVFECGRHSIKKSWHLYNMCWKEKRNTIRMINNCKTYFQTSK